VLNTTCIQQTKRSSCLKPDLPNLSRVAGRILSVQHER